MDMLVQPAPARLRNRTRIGLAGLFFASGFSSLIYQIVWLRMAFGHFGIVTPVLSVVISVFMLGLGLGALAAGRWGARLAAGLRWPPAALYGAAELLIGVGAIAVPHLFALGEHLLLGAGSAGSAAYLALSALAISGAILPWCLLMGATVPLMMGFVRARWPDDERSFSWLYAANVAGAATGTIASACVLIERFGFTGTSLIAAGVNLLIAAVSFVIARSADAMAAPGPLTRFMITRPAIRMPVPADLILFTTGFCSMAMEVIWTRGFTAVLQTTIYSFAAILATYLVGTAFGAAAYREQQQQGRLPGIGWLLGAAALTSCLPMFADDPRVQHTPSGVLLSLLPFCMVLGFLTPMLVDQTSAGDPRRAGRVYAINILGCTLGPLVAGYALVIAFDVRICLLILTVPLFGLALLASPRLGMALASALALLVGGFVSRSYEGGALQTTPHELHRDYAATAIAIGTGMRRELLVNGTSITFLTPVTKLMAHLPLALHPRPRDGLVICFGMGTSFRSMASWGVDTTAVDLTGTVFRTFGFFHDDADEVRRRPNTRLIADDGRRFLARTDAQYDVIVIDPPPPLEAAGSSLLYSREMYDVVKRHLRAGGILQQWFPGGETAIRDAIARTLKQAFPYVAAFASQPAGGVHYLASMAPIPDLSGDTLAARLPEAARRDLVEWTPGMTSADILAGALSRRISDGAIVPYGATIITDDAPFNEYFLLRRMR